ncbi:DUF4251 domain-containing protein [Streptomyces parvus]|uniref:DUF4251 domain-containing protein n=1 Tax=Streptomyces parvus TaxID=66428 RepID=A0A7K3S524_9ACTN|nr:DUF4251 domain-containing protein [Streptomyces parvus]NEC22614.1 DUF4251 domain-containing protein [Streptomyces parvus]
MVSHPKNAAGRQGKRIAAVATVGAVMCAGLVAMGSSAHAAGDFCFSVKKYKDGSAQITINPQHRSRITGVVQWQADPGTFPLWIKKGDTLRVNDADGDGYSIFGQVVHANGAPKYYRSGHTAGHKAPYSVIKSENLAEGRKLQLRACVTKGAKNIQCSPYYAIHA